MIKRVIATLATAAVIVAGTANSAMASWGQCLNGYVCLYTAQGGASAPFQWTAGYVRQEGGIDFSGRSYDNNISSIKNRSNGVFRMYDRYQCAAGTPYFILNPGAQATYQGTNWNDKISSFEEETDGRLGHCPD